MPYLTQLLALNLIGMLVCCVLI